MAEDKNVENVTEEAVSPQAEEVAREINSEAQAEQPTGEQQQEPKPAEPDYQTVLRDFVGREQGRIADTFGRKADELERRVVERVDNALKPYQEMMQKQEQSHIEGLEPEDQLEYWKQKAQQPVETAQQEQQQLSPEQSVLAQEVQSLITQYGANVQLTDPSLWAGYTQGMSVGQSMKLAEANLKRMAAPQQPAQPQQASPTVATAPSTQGAPQKTARSVNTLSEAATLFADGNINSNQYRNIKAQIAKDGSATL